MEYTEKSIEKTSKRIVMYKDAYYENIYLCLAKSYEHYTHSF